MAIFISAGHNNNDPGASGNGLIEAVEARKVRDRVISFISSGYKIVKDDDNWDLSQTMVNFETGEKSACIDIHFDSGPAGATGVTVYHPDNASADEIYFGKHLSGQLSRDMKIRDRGAKPEALSARKRLGMMRENGINLLVELGFISNPNDMKGYQENFDKVCETIAIIAMNMDDKYK